RPSRFELGMGAGRARQRQSRDHRGCGNLVHDVHSRESDLSAKAEAERQPVAVIATRSIAIAVRGIAIRIGVAVVTIGTAAVAVGPAHGVADIGTGMIGMISIMALFEGIVQITVIAAGLKTFRVFLGMFGTKFAVQAVVLPAGAQLTHVIPIGTGAVIVAVTI